MTNKGYSDNKTPSQMAPKSDIWYFDERLLIKGSNSGSTGQTNSTGKPRGQRDWETGMLTTHVP